MKAKKSTNNRSKYSKSQKSSLSRFVPRTNKSKLLLFVIVFGLIGGIYFVYQSFANTDGSRDRIVYNYAVDGKPFNLFSARTSDGATNAKSSEGVIQLTNNTSRDISYIDVKTAGRNNSQVFFAKTRYSSANQSSKAEIWGMNILGGGQRKLLDSEFGTRGRLNHKLLAESANSYQNPQHNGFAVDPGASRLYIPLWANADGGPAIVSISATDAAANERSGPTVVSSRGSNSGFNTIRDIQITADGQWAAYLRSNGGNPLEWNQNPSDPRWRVTTQLCYVPLPSGAPTCTRVGSSKQSVQQFKLAPSTNRAFLEIVNVDAYAQNPGHGRAVVSRNLFGTPVSATHTWLSQLRGTVSFKPNGTAINLSDKIGTTINNTNRALSDSVNFREVCEQYNERCNSATLEDSLFIDNDRVARIVREIYPDQKRGYFIYIVNTRTNQVESRMETGLAPNESTNWFKMY